jgi:hypothetical protein
MVTTFFEHGHTKNVPSCKGPRTRCQPLTSNEKAEPKAQNPIQTTFFEHGHTQKTYPSRKDRERVVNPSHQTKRRHQGPKSIIGDHVFEHGHTQKTCPSHNENVLSTPHIKRKGDTQGPKSHMETFESTGIPKNVPQLARTENALSTLTSNEKAEPKAQNPTIGTTFLSTAYLKKRTLATRTEIVLSTPHIKRKGDTQGPTSLLRLRFLSTAYSKNVPQPQGPRTCCQPPHIKRKGDT